MPRRAINIVAPCLALLLLASAATSSGGAKAVTGAQSGAAPARMNERGLIAYWWNDGSCHGYPDVMRIYAVELDGNGNVVEYRYAGYTSGWDTCSTYHSGEIIQSAYTWADGQWITGVVQGDPNGSTTEHP